MPDLFDKFSERARRVLTLAQEEAQRLNHNHIGPEHLLLGLLRESEGIAAKVLSNFGVKLEAVRAAIVSTIGAGDRAVIGEIGLTPRAKRVIELGIDEARRLNHGYIGTEHLLLGLIREGEGIAADMLATLGVNLERVRAETTRILQANQPGAARALGDTMARVLMQAQQNAIQRGKHVVDTEHVLLSLLVANDSMAWSVLEIAGIDRDAVRRSLEELMAGTAGGPTEGPVRLSPGTLKVLMLAREEAGLLGQQHLGTQHLLLGVLREAEGVGARALTAASATLDGLREAARSVAGEHPSTAGIMTRAVGGASSGASQRIDKFSERARRVLTFAQEEAQRFNHTYIGTEHLLLGLVRERDGVAAKVLANVGVDLNKVRSAVEFIIGRGGRTPGEVGLTPHAKKAIELAVEEVRRLNHGYIGTEHLLLGLVREVEGVAAGVLESLGVDSELVWQEAMRVLQQNQAEAEAAPPQPTQATPEPVTPIDDLRLARTRIRYAISEAKAAGNEELAAELEEIERRMDEIIKKYGEEG